MAYPRMHGITKLYTTSGVLANDAVDLSVEENEVHAVIGENGDGKSTLMKLLYGLEQPNAGEILFRGEKVAIRDPLVAIYLGNKTPHGILIACLVFGFAESFSNYAQGAINVPADFILTFPYVITVVAMIAFSIVQHYRLRGSER